MAAIKRGSAAGCRSGMNRIQQVTRGQRRRNGTLAIPARHAACLYAELLGDQGLFVAEQTGHWRRSAS